MSLTPSNMMPLGTKAPNFELLDTITGQQKTLEDLKSNKATVVMFICNHCPFVLHIIDKLVEVADKYKQKGISFVAISSNDIESHPQDAPDNMKQLAKDKGFSFPYLYDETQEVAKAYLAACTPDMYVFDTDLKCMYRGRFDAATPGKKVEVTGEDLTNALDCILTNTAVSDSQLPSMGCNIKWK